MVTGCPAALAPLPGGGKRASAAHANADMVCRPLPLWLTIGTKSAAMFDDADGTVREGFRAK